MTQRINPSRRRFIKSVTATTVAGMLWPAIGSSATKPFITKAIPSSGQQIPSVHQQRADQIDAQLH